METILAIAVVIAIGIMIYLPSLDNEKREETLRKVGVLPPLREDGSGP